MSSSSEPTEYQIRQRMRLLHINYYKALEQLRKLLQASQK